MNQGEAEAKCNEEGAVLAGVLNQDEVNWMADTKTTRSSSRISNRRRFENQCSLRPPKSQFETKTPRYRLKKKELKAMPPEQKIDHVRHQNLKNSAKYRQRQKVKLAEKEIIVEELEAELKQAETESMEMENEYKGTEIDFFLKDAITHNGHHLENLNPSITDKYTSFLNQARILQVWDAITYETVPLPIIIHDYIATYTRMSNNRRSVAAVYLEDYGYTLKFPFSPVIADVLGRYHPIEVCAVRIQRPSVNSDID
ncbi:hypothetical protein CRE_06569 [Caenorhabditis remanei]|uniref:BZIP domain-containing protein n=1 Tax=Caenorhabditis remanei TaxID=31234 RepID=E3M1K9_CAERE|nr:hypothetical protein CRE_06569 [Caenorhabditis remanei]